MKTVYLDTCSLQRPLDDQSQLRIRLEAEAILSVLDLADERQITIVSSDVLMFEIRKNPHPTRRDFALDIAQEMEEHVALSETIEARAGELN